MLLVAKHTAFEGLSIVQELSPESHDETLLAKSKGGSFVTIKILIDRPIPETVSTALTREASQTGRLAHEAIVQTKRLVLEPDLAALMTEFVAGVSLQRLLRFASSRGVRLPDAACWYVVERLLAALAHAHSQKDATGAPAPVLHRDVSPSAIIVGWNGVTKVGDFGLTKMRALVAPHANKPEPLTPILSPEQARGAEPTARSDVFLAALVAMRLATGRTPYARYRKSNAQMLLAMSEADVVPLAKTRRDLPGAVVEAFGHALLGDPSERNVTAEELHGIVRASFDLARGKDALATLVTRWREPLEKSVSPWELRASMTDAAPAADPSLREGALSLALPDERPSDAAIVTVDRKDDEPWNKGSVPREEAALSATDPVHSTSRVGSVAPDALLMPLPAMRITMPSVPVYGGPAVNVPLPQKRGAFAGRTAALAIFIVFAGLLVATVILFKWLLRM